MKKSDNIDRGEISAAHSTGTIGAVIVGGEIRVVKKEKKEENDNNNNGITLLNHRDTHTIHFQQQQPKQTEKKKKKEEEDAVKKEENDGDAVPVSLVERKKTKMTTFKKKNCYADWKTGNWCWLSSNTIEEGMTMAMINTNSQQQCCVKLEDSNDTNNNKTVASTVNGPTSTAVAAAITTSVATNNSIATKATAKTCRSSESNGDGNGNGKCIIGPPKKKLKMNNIKKEDGIDDDSDNSKEYNGNNYNTDGMKAGVIKKEIINNDRNHRHHKDDNSIDQAVDVMIKEEETETDTKKGNSECKIKATNSTNGNGNGNKNSVNTNHNDDGYESWTEGSWCWLISASSRGGGSGGGVSNSSLKQHTIQHHDYDNNQRLLNDRREKQQHNSFESEEDDYDDDNKKTKTDCSKNNNNKQDEDEDEGEAVRDDDDDDDDIDDDYDDDDYDDYGCDEKEEDTEYRTNNASNKYNDEHEITVEEDDDDENDDTRYDSWTEGSWCWLLPNSTLATTTKNKIVHLSDHLLPLTKTTRVRHRTRKTKTPEHIIYTHSQNEQWNNMSQRLVAYQKQYQTTIVPKKWKDDPQLANWVTRQRQSFKKGTLSNERVNVLKSIDFVWKLVDQVPWMEMYQRLVVYKNQHQTIIVSKRSKDDRKLATWVQHQRTIYMNKELSVEQTNYLDSIGFVWKIRCDYVPWIEMYKRLVAYKQHNQSTRVPCNYTEDPPLGKWVSTQRTEYKKDIMSARRMELLNSIDFVWCAK